MNSHSTEDVKYQAVSEGEDKVEGQSKRGKDE